MNDPLARFSRGHVGPWPPPDRFPFPGQSSRPAQQPLICLAHLPPCPLHLTAIRLLHRFPIQMASLQFDRGHDIGMMAARTET